MYMYVLVYRHKYPCQYVCSVMHVCLHECTRVYIVHIMYMHEQHVCTFIHVRSIHHIKHCVIHFNCSEETSG